MIDPLLTCVGALHWLLILELANFSSGIAKPVVCDFHVTDDLCQLDSANHAPFCYTTVVVRSPREAIEDVLVASFHVVEHHGGITLANPHGSHYLLLLVGRLIFKQDLANTCRYYPIGLFRNAIPDGQVTERGGLMFLLIWGFMIFTSTFTDMVIAGVESAETGGNIADLMFSLMLIFNGVLAGPSTLPGFWIFMYRVSPFTYLVGGMLSTGLANTNVECSDIEYLNFNPAPGMNCSTYLEPYISVAGGYLTDATKGASSNCQFCPVSDTNTFLASFNSYYSHRWRNFGLIWAYIVFNVAGAVFLYWLVRVPKKAKKEKKD